MNDFNDPRPIATSDEFKAALLATRDWIGISPTQLHILQAQCRASDSVITAAQIADQLALKNCAAARAEGLEAVRFLDAGSLRAELAARGLV